MKPFKTMIAGLAFASLAAVSVAEATAPAQPAGFRTGIVIGKAEKQLTLWTRNGREKFDITSDSQMPQRKLKDGNLVAVSETAPGTGKVQRVLIIDEQVVVTGKNSREYAVIGTTEQAQSPSHLMVRTTDGKQAFVIDPKTFRQPLPKPNQKVALTYRIENVVPPIYKATGLVVLGDVYDDAPVKITYSDIPQPEPVVAVNRPAPAPAPLPAPQAVLAELPQTAGRTPLVLLAGLLLLGAGAAIKMS